MQRRFLAVLVIVTVVVTLLFASAAGAQESNESGASAPAEEGEEAAVESQAQDNSAADEAAGEVQGQEEQVAADEPEAEARAREQSGPLVFAEGEQAGEVRAAATTQSGALRGKEVETRSTDTDRRVEVMRIPFPNGCKLVENKVSFVLEDDDGTQADFIEGENVKVVRDGDVLRVTRHPDFGGPGDSNNNIVPLNERGGDEQLDTGGLTVVASTGIKCENENAGDGDNNGNTGGDADNEDGDGDPSAEQDLDADVADPTADANAADATADANATDADAASEGSDTNSFRCELFLREVGDVRIGQRGQYHDAFTVRRIEQCLVLADTIPRRLLPNTGGMSLLGLAALGLASIVVGASVLRAAIRRRR